jgi:hypothetical protein
MPENVPGLVNVDSPVKPMRLIPAIVVVSALDVLETQSVGLRSTPKARKLSLTSTLPVEFKKAEVLPK